MRVINKSRKIIAINGEPLLPGNNMVLPEGMENHPSVKSYLAKGSLVDAANPEPIGSTGGISDDERARIAEEAIAKYKAEQEAAAKDQAEKEAEVKAVNKMKKEELITKAMGMGIEISDSETADAIKSKILDQLNQQ